MEKWKYINGFENYMISNLGRVKSIERLVNCKIGQHLVMERILKPSLARGYNCVNIYQNRKVKNLKIARCVGDHFVDNPENLPLINHKDGIKTNDFDYNLEWATYSDNINHAYANGLRSNIKKINQFNLSGILIKTWDSIQEAARNGYDAGNICLCCQGKRKSHKMFIWSYY